MVHDCPTNSPQSSRFSKDCSDKNHRILAETAVISSHPVLADGETELPRRVNQFVLVARWVLGSKPAGPNRDPKPGVAKEIMIPRFFWLNKIV